MVERRGRALMLGVLTFGMLLPSAASAAPVADVSMGPAEVLAVNGVVAVEGDTATISFVYRCSGAEEADLWLSAKQLDDPTATDPSWDFDTHETSLQSASWYDTHATVPCDTDGKGRARRATVDVQRADYDWAPRDWDQMTSGVAFVQVCLSIGDGEQEGDAFAAFYDWRQARSR